jgi:hypothetical protein
VCDGPNDSALVSGGLIPDCGSGDREKKGNVEEGPTCIGLLTKSTASFSRRTVAY